LLFAAYNRVDNFSLLPRINSRTVIIAIS